MATATVATCWMESSLSTNKGRFDNGARPAHIRSRSFLIQKIPAIRGIPAANDLESFECIHFNIQGTGSHPAIQGDAQDSSVTPNLTGLDAANHNRASGGGRRMFLTSPLQKLSLKLESPQLEGQ